MDLQSATGTIEELAKLLNLKPARCDQLRRAGVFPEPKKVEGINSKQWDIPACIEAYWQYKASKKPQTDDKTAYFEEQAVLLKHRSDRAELELVELRENWKPRDRVELGKKVWIENSTKRIRQLPEEILAAMNALPSEQRINPNCVCGVATDVVYSALTDISQMTLPPGLDLDR